MRIIDEYCFKTGTQIPFSELPDIIHSFFTETGVSYNKFLYYFGDIVCRGDVLSKRGCVKILKDCPKLGELTLCEGEKAGSFNNYFISNISSYSENMENDILPLMKKIHKYYGMSENVLYYYDVDFFGKVIPFGRDTSIAEERYAKANVSCDYNYSLYSQPYGSGIKIYRDCLDTYLLLSVDVLIDGKVMDSSHFAEMLQKHLPGIKRSDSQKFILTQHELKETEENNKKAGGLIRSIREYYDSIMPSSGRQNGFSSKFAMAPTLKKYAKKYGYIYENVYSGVYCLEKAPGTGPIIRLTVDSGPSRYSADFILEITAGPGYEHQLFYTMQTPTDQESFDICVDKFFDLVNDFESRFYPELSEIFPPVPAWYKTGK